MIFQQPGVEENARVVIFAETQLNWMVAAFATWFLKGQAGIGRNRLIWACPLGRNTSRQYFHVFPRGKMMISDIYGYPIFRSETMMLA